MGKMPSLLSLYVFLITPHWFGTLKHTLLAKQWHHPSDSMVFRIGRGCSLCRFRETRRNVLPYQKKVFLTSLFQRGIWFHHSLLWGRSPFDPCHGRNRASVYQIRHCNIFDYFTRAEMETMLCPIKD